MQPRSQGFSLLRGGDRPHEEGKSPGNAIIGHVLNDQGTGYEHSISIELKMGHVISKSIQKLENLPNLMVIGLNAKAWYTVKIRELSIDWRTPVPRIHTKCTMPLGLNQ